MKKTSLSACPARVMLMLSVSLAALAYNPVAAETIAAGDVRIITDGSNQDHPEGLVVDGGLYLRNSSGVSAWVPNDAAGVLIGAGGVVSVGDDNSYARLSSNRVVVDGGEFYVGANAQFDSFGGFVVRNGGRARLDMGHMMHHFSYGWRVEGVGSKLTYGTSALAGHISPPTPLFDVVVSDGGELEITDQRQVDLLNLTLNRGVLSARNGAQVNVHSQLSYDDGDRLEITNGGRVFAYHQGEVVFNDAQFVVDAGELHAPNGALVLREGAQGVVSNNGTLHADTIIVDGDSSLTLLSGARNLEVVPDSQTQVLNNGAVVVDGAGSVLSAQMLTNSNSSAKMTATNGGRIGDGDDTMRAENNSQVTVSGAGSVVNLATLSIDNSGLTVNEGADAVIGNLVADQSARLSFGGAARADIARLVMAGSTVVVEGGAVLDADELFASNLSRVTVRQSGLDGPAGRAEVGTLALTDSGLSVENGGVVEAESLSFAKTRPGFAAVDDVYVTGTGASVVVAGEAEVSVNQGMTAFVSVVNGGQFVAQRLTFGGQGGHRVVVAGEQTLLQAQEDVVFGSSGELNNDLTVRDGATLRVGGGDGTLVMNGGCLSIGGGYCYALTEAAAESATLDVGRLSFGNQGANGQYPGSFLMLNHTDDAYTLDADIDGYGIVAVLNGSTRLTGAATHTGGTLVFNGEAIVDGTLEGEVRLQGQTIVPTDSGGAAFAVLRGRGTVGSIDASAASRVQAGDDLSIGTLTATGSATFHEGSEYRARLAANGQADRLNVQGSVTIEGGTVFHMVAVDLLDAYAPNSLYTVMSAVDGITGRFSSVVENFAYLNAEVEYGTNDMRVVLARAPIVVEPPVVPVDPPVVPPVVPVDPPVVPPVIPPVVDPEPPVVPPVVDPEPPVVPPVLPPVVEPQPPVVPPVVPPVTPPVVDPEPPVVTPISFASLTGTLNAGAAANAVEGMGEDAALYRRALFLQAGETQSVFQQLSGEIHPSIAGVFLDRSRFARSAVLDRAFNVDGVRGTWASVADGRTDATGGASADASSKGATMMVGVDRATDGGWVFGAALGTDRADVASAGASADVSGVVGAFYGARDFGATRLAFGVTHARADVDTERSVVGSTINETLDGATDAKTTQIFVEAAHSVQRGATTITPHVGLAHAWSRVDGFTESGGLSALSVASTEVERTTATVGVRGERGFVVGSTPVVVSGGVAYERRFGGLEAVSTAAFAGSDPFQVQAPGSSRSVARVDLGVGVSLAPNTTLRASYSGAFGADGNDSAVGLGLKINF